MDPERERSGDYGYDLVHEETGSRRLPDETPREHSGPSSPPPEDLSGDYGYDEAHGF